jgi:DNA (cytosine-5)-methyltransferase 1
VVFEEVCTDLENQGYTVQPILLPACAVGAPHRRDRVWFVAYSNGAMFRTEKYGSIRCENGESESKGAQGIYNAVGSNGNSGTATNSDSIRQHQCECDNEEQPSERRFNALNDTNENDGQGNVTNTLCERLQRSIQTRKHDVIEWNRQDKKNEQHLHSFKSKLRFENFPTQPPICSGDDGLPTELDGITFPKWRQESIKGYGNAIVPQVAYEIFKVIAEMDRLEKLQLKLF